ncbi:MAG: hypothetical protein ABIF77_00200, partial [bacterium]
MLWIALLAMVALISACGSDDDTTTPPTPTTTTVGATGGTVTSGNDNLVIPAGALGGNVDFT